MGNFFKKEQAPGTFGGIFPKDWPTEDSELPGGRSLEGAPWRGGLSPAGPSAPGGNRPVTHLQEGRVVSLTEWPGPGVEMRPHQRAQTLPRGPPGPPPPGLA